MRIALYGGTFDPVHEGHLAVARLAIDRARLDEVWFVPSGRPPHKTGARPTAYPHRFRMVELATAADDRLIASPLEDPSEIPGPHYSVSTVARARSQLALGDSLYFLIGQDAFQEIPLWHDWESLLRLVEFLVVNRRTTNGDTLQPPPGARFTRLELDHPGSSSELRRRLAAGERQPIWLPAQVGTYIREHQLYGTRSDAGAGR